MLQPIARKINQESTSDRSAEARPTLAISGINTVFANFVQMACFVLSSVIMARALGPTGKGAIDLYVMTTSFMVLFTAWPIQTGVTYVVARGRINLRGLIIILSKISFVQAFISFTLLALAFYTPWSSSVLPAHMGIWAVGLVTLGSFMDIRRANWRAILAGERQFIHANNSDIVRRAVEVIGLLLLASLGKLGWISDQSQLFACVIALIFASGASSLTGRYFVRVPSKEFAFTSGIRDAAHFALPGQVATIFQFFADKFSLYMAAAYIGVAGLAMLQIAMLIGEGLLIVPGIAGQILFPTVAAGISDSKDEINRTLTVCRTVLVFCLICSITTALAAPWLIPLCYGEVFSGTVLALLLLLPGIVVQGVRAVLSSHLAGMGRVDINMKVSGVCMLATVLLSFELVPSHGIYGAAVTNCISCMIGAALNMEFFCRLTKSSRSAMLIPRRKDIILWIDLVYNNVLKPLLDRRDNRAAGVSPHVR